MGAQAYSNRARELRQLPVPGDGDAKQALLQAATLAASSHNTQPWTFRVTSDSITIEPDFTRRCEVVDPDDSHLFKSLGCAAENIVAAAPAYGFATGVQITDAGRIGIDLVRSGKATDRRALGVIAERQCTKTPYDGRPLAPAKAATDPSSISTWPRLLVSGFATMHPEVSATAGNVFWGILLVLIKGPSHINVEEVEVP